MCAQVRAHMHEYAEVRGSLLCHTYLRQSICSASLWLWLLTSKPRWHACLHISSTGDMGTPMPAFSQAIGSGLGTSYLCTKTRTLPTESSLQPSLIHSEQCSCLDDFYSFDFTDNNKITHSFCFLLNNWKIFSGPDI